MKDSTNPVEKKDKKDESGGFFKTPMIFPDRVDRGGYWSSYPYYMQASDRSSYYPTGRNYYVGFRLVKNKGKT
jgi:formylglycine-generating enzyme required for sulfatase activity